MILNKFYQVEEAPIPDGVLHVVQYEITGTAEQVKEGFDVPFWKWLSEKFDKVQFRLLPHFTPRLQLLSIRAIRKDFSDAE